MSVNADYDSCGLRPWRTGAGAAYGTAKSGIGIAGIGTFRPDLIMKVGIAIEQQATSG